MILHVLRALFILMMATAGYFLIQQADPVSLPPWVRDYTWLALAGTITFGVFLVSVDILAPRKKLVVFSGTFLGLLVGLIIAYSLSFVVQLLVEQWIGGATAEQRHNFIQVIDLLLGVIACYLSISFILQTKDDFRFVIPYVEFSKQTKGARPILLDTSVLIDGRITDIVQTGIIESQLVVPQFVIDELQLIADSGDKLKRNRGRRGLDVMQKLRGTPHADVAMYDASAREIAGAFDVDQKLVHLAHEMNARILTNDFNLNKVAQLRGVDVININDLAGALKPVVLPGEKMSVRLIKPGDEPGQGVGYLEDGTMVVVEGGRQSLNQDVEFTVTSALQTKAGKMIFGRMNHK
jgi:uncharacterized protein YacL